MIGSLGAVAVDVKRAGLGGPARPCLGRMAGLKLLGFIWRLAGLEQWKLNGRAERFLWFVGFFLLGGGIKFKLDGWVLLTLLVGGACGRIVLWIEGILPIVPVAGNGQLRVAALANCDQIIRVNFLAGEAVGGAPSVANCGGFCVMAVMGVKGKAG